MLALQGNLQRAFVPATPRPAPLLHVLTRPASSSGREGLRAAVRSHGSRRQADPLPPSATREGPARQRHEGRRPDDGHWQEGRKEEEPSSPSSLPRHRSDARPSLPASHRIDARPSVPASHGPRVVRDEGGTARGAPPQEGPSGRNAWREDKEPTSPASSALVPPPPSSSYSPEELGSSAQNSTSSWAASHAGGRQAGQALPVVRGEGGAARRTPGSKGSFFSSRGFQELGVSTEIITALKSLGITRPSHIQVCARMHVIIIMYAFVVFVVITCIPVYIISSF